MFSVNLPTIRKPCLSMNAFFAELLIPPRLTSGRDISSGPSNATRKHSLPTSVQFSLIVVMRLFYGGEIHGSCRREYKNKDTASMENTHLLSKAACCQPLLSIMIVQFSRFAPPLYYNYTYHVRLSREVTLSQR